MIFIFSFTNFTIYSGSSVSGPGVPDIDVPSTEKFAKVEEERALKASLMKELQELEVLLEKRLRAAELKRMVTHTMHEEKVCEHEPSVPPMCEPAMVCEKHVTLTAAPSSTPAVSHKLNCLLQFVFFHEAPSLHHAC